MKKMVFQLTILISLAFSISIFSPSSLYAKKVSGAKQDCLEYGHQVQLTGNLVRETFPGPPNFESVEKGDIPEVAWILYLDKPVCIKGRAGDDFDVGISYLKALQLVMGNKDYYQRAKGLLSKKVIVTGLLFGAHTGHHHTPVLIDVKDIQLMEDKY
jgi:hypothetical protein